MKVAGIIAECNPLHEGHKYIFQKAREVSGADYVAAVISGDFVQRGEPAVLSKEIRTGMLLNAGVDLVLELPVYYACAGAEYFARGGVSLLSRLGVVTDLCFGSESGNIDAITEAARFLEAESEEFRFLVRKYMSEGATYAAAFARAYAETNPNENLSTKSILVQGAPNDLLGCLYVKTLCSENSSIIPHAIPRISADSASSLRKIMYEKGSCMSFELFSMAMEYKLRSLSSAYESTKQADYLDVSSDLMNKIINELRYFEGIDSFRMRLKSRNNTYTGISRALLHILLDIKASEMENFTKSGITGYARILGFKKEAAPLLHEIKNRSSIPLISKLAGAEDLISKPFDTMFRTDIAASELYDMGLRYLASQNENTYANAPYSEMVKKVIIL